MKKSHLLLFLSVCLTALQSQAQVNLDSTLIAHLNFNGNANDATGNGHNGTVNGTTLTTDQYGNANSAYQFDGIDDFIEIQHHVDLTPVKGEEFAISLWFKADTSHPSSYKVSDLVSKWASSHVDTPYSYTIRLNNPSADNDPGCVVANRYDKFSCTGIHKVTSNPISLNGWHHVVYQFDGDSLAMYLDGNLVGKVEDNTNCSVFNTSDIFLGRRAEFHTPSRFPFYGKMDEFRFYGRSLSQAEITALYNPTSSISDNNIHSSLAVYPNPTDGTINISSELIRSGQTQVLIYNQIGELVATEMAMGSGSYTTQLDLAAGVYTLELVNQQTATRSKFIVID